MSCSTLPTPSVHRSSVTPSVLFFFVPAITSFAPPVRAVQPALNLTIWLSTSLTGTPNAAYTPAPPDSVNTSP